MSDNNPLIHYCVILSNAQLDFLFDTKSAIDRKRCLHRLMTGAVRERTTHCIKGVEITLEVGQVAASDVELAQYMGCNRKTIGKLMGAFNRLGMLTTKANNRTSVHTLHFLTGWYVGGVRIINPHYAKPSEASKCHASEARTPHARDAPPTDRRNATPTGSPSGQGGMDSTEARTEGILSSLSLPEASG